MIFKPRKHAGAFDAYRLVKKQDDQNRNAGRNHQVAHPEAQAATWRLHCAGASVSAGIGASIGDEISVTTGSGGTVDIFYLKLLIARSLTATQTTRRAQKFWMSRFWQWLWLTCCRHHRRRRPGHRSLREVLVFQNQRPLQHHFHLRPGLDVHVGATREKRYQANGSKSCAESRQPATQRMSR